jgi:uncharacterized protein YgiM (DUF1202 family)
MGFLLVLAPACATTPPSPPARIYYSIPAISYLRSCPGLDCPVVSEIYLGDEVQLMESRPDGWWRVRSPRDETVGWTQRPLLSERPLSGQTFQVAVKELPLRDSPHPEATARRRLEFGDRVQKLTERQEWWRVLAEKDRAIGWVPAVHLAETLPPAPVPEAPRGEGDAGAAPAPAPVYLYVASDTAALHLLPLKDSRVLRRLKLNDKVESIAESGPRWRKVRFPETGAEGWVETRLLRREPVTARGQIVPATGKPARKAPPPEKTPPPQMVPEAGPEPEAM